MNTENNELTRNNKLHYIHKNLKENVLNNNNATIKKQMFLWEILFLIFFYPEFHPSESSWGFSPSLRTSKTHVALLQEKLDRKNQHLRSYGRTGLTFYGHFSIFNKLSAPATLSHTHTHTHTTHCLACFSVQFIRAPLYFSLSYNDVGKAVMDPLTLDTWERFPYQTSHISTCKSFQPDPLNKSQPTHSQSPPNKTKRKKGISPDVFSVFLTPVSSVKDTFSVIFQ